LDELEKEGKVEVSYHLLGQQGNLLIVDVNSDDELSKIVGEDPMFFHSEREVYALTTRETHKKYLKKVLGLL